MNISVIIPALNEAENIVACLRSVLAQPGLHEIVVVDGGSTDGTPKLAAALARVMVAPRGRAKQMNAGARASRGDVLLFLHSDTRLPAGALLKMRDSLADGRVVGGTFRLRFDADHPLLRFYSFCTRFPFRLFHFGDQGIFVRREIFERLGGFAEIPFLEDVDFLRRLRKVGKVVLIPADVITSARRFLQHGIVRQQLWNIALVSAYHLGARPEDLARFYSLHTSPVARMGGRAPVQTTPTTEHSGPPPA
jgi:rSAM/selenodomain-associated transferase 2